MKTEIQYIMSFGQKTATIVHFAIGVPFSFNYEVKQKKKKKSLGDLLNDDDNITHRKFSSCNKLLFCFVVTIGRKGLILYTVHFLHYLCFA